MDEDAKYLISFCPMERDSAIPDFLQGCLSGEETDFGKQLLCSGNPRLTSTRHEYISVVGTSYWRVVNIICSEN